MNELGYHESTKDLPEYAKDMHRALKTLAEECEAIDWYQQRLSATKDPKLKSDLMHLLIEEKEHAVIMIAYLFHKDEQLRNAWNNFHERKIEEEIGDQEEIDLYMDKVCDEMEKKENKEGE